MVTEICEGGVVKGDGQLRIAVGELFWKRDALSL
jgi:hypothetical protein